MSMVNLFQRDMRHARSNPIDQGWNGEPEGQASAHSAVYPTSPSCRSTYNASGGSACWPPLASSAIMSQPMLELSCTKPAERRGSRWIKLSRCKSVRRFHCRRDEMISEREDYRLSAA